MRKLIKTETILNYLKENKMSKTEFARRCGISVHSLNCVLANKMNIKTSVVLRIVNKMHWNFIDILED